MLPVTASARKDDPLLIELAAAKGKSFPTQDATLTIHGETSPPSTSTTVISGGEPGALDRL